MRFFSIGATLFAVTAMAVLSMLPAEHLHRSHSGPPVVHRHATDGAVDHAGIAFEQGDHHGAKTLELRYMARRHYDLGRPLIAVELVLVAPEQPMVARVDVLETPMTHGPPLRIGPPLRAPPA